MLDLARMDRYREDSRLEAKLATGGLPESIWETYSAFANTGGGVILLGVEELPDHTLRIQGLLDPEELLEAFWARVNDPHTASVNLLEPGQARVVQAPGGAVLVIEVPPAPASARPVYVGGDPYRGSYRREGEADIHCSHGEVEAMLRAREGDPASPGQG